MRLRVRFKGGDNLADVCTRKSGYFTCLQVLWLSISIRSDCVEFRRKEMNQRARLRTRKLAVYQSCSAGRSCLKQRSEPALQVDLVF